MVFADRLRRGELVFFVIGEHPFNEHYTIPGVTRDEHDEYIIRKKNPVEIRCDNMAPFFVTKPGFSGYDSKAYWAALDDLMAKYNRLVLTELKRREVKPNQTPEPTSGLAPGRGSS